MISAWRIVLASELASAFSGEGARLVGGRWNSPGIRILYVAEHQSTAALEIVVHASPLSAEVKYKAFRLEWPESITEIFRSRDLPENWRTSPPPHQTMEIGDRWAEEKRSAVLAVPSAISPDDRNFLLSPEHPDFRRIRIAPPIDYEFDPRLIGR
jgi:RES domain-containing protein